MLQQREGQEVQEEEDQGKRDEDVHLQLKVCQPLQQGKACPSSEVAEAQVGFLDLKVSQGLVAQPGHFSGSGPTLRVRTGTRGPFGLPGPCLAGG